MADAYATYGEYVTDTGDSDAEQARVEAMLAQQSAKLRAVAGITGTDALTADQLLLCRYLVTDACRKALVSPMSEAMGDLAGMRQASFSANGFQGTYTMANASGSAYFDRSTLSALMRTLRRGQLLGTIGGA